MAASGSIAMLSRIVSRRASASRSPAVQRARAPPGALLAARASWTSGERDAEALRETIRDSIAIEPLAAIDYASCADGVTLAELDRVDGPALLSLAVRFGTTRLIDNEPL